MPVKANAAFEPGGIAALGTFPEFQRLKWRLIDSTGLQYYADKDSAMAHCVAHRADILGLDPRAYIDHVLDPERSEEFASLIDEITIGESYFFRDPGQFEALRRDILPVCLARNRAEKALSIWSAGCATGAEPYSIAIMLARDFVAETAGWSRSILATDMNRRALEAARAGLFTAWDLRSVGIEIRRQCFTEEEGGFRLVARYREAVHFAEQNLVTDLESFAERHRDAFDVILCRNVMIYFTRDFLRRVVRALRRCLAPGGWLLVGHAEPYFEIAEFLSPAPGIGPAIYRKEPSAANSVPGSPTILGAR